MLKDPIITNKTDLEILVSAEKFKEVALKTSFSACNLIDTADYISRFRHTGVKATVSNYAEFLSIYFKPNIIRYLSRVSRNWCHADKNDLTGVSKRELYLIRKFIVEPLVPLQAEELFIENCSSYGVCISVVNGEKSKFADFFISKKKKEIAIKLKSLNWFNSLKDRDIKKLIEKVSGFGLNTIFAISIKEEIYFLVRDKDSEGCKFISSSEFMKLFDMKISDKALLELSVDTLNRLIGLNVKELVKNSFNYTDSFPKWE